MAEGIWLALKNAGPGDQVINDISAVIINADDAQTEAQVKAAANTACATVFPGLVLPTGYFETAFLISNLTSGPLQDNLDAYVFAGERVAKVG